MLRVPIKPRSDWKQTAKDYGFKFHTMYGEPYWDESAYYQFSLAQIEQQLEPATEELHQMCLQVVDTVVRDSQWLRRFQIPEKFWQSIYDSWLRRDPSLYSRLDLVYDGTNAPKLLENNADTPTSVYETGFWQWLWLEEQVNAGRLRRDSDQFNSLQEKLVYRFKEIGWKRKEQTLYFSCCKDTEEDRGTVQYMEDCAAEAGFKTDFVYIEDIGFSECGKFTDSKDKAIEWMFKLYPWEFMHRETYGNFIESSGLSWVEPHWKCILSNKALLPMLWSLFPNHPNLLPAFFEGDVAAEQLTDYVRKPIYSREGANISLHRQGKVIESVDGPYGEEGFVLQSFHELPKFGDHYALIGSWLVNDKAAGISIREDASQITQDLSRFLPHVILD